MKIIVALFGILILPSCSWFRPKYISGRENQLIPDFELLLRNSQTKMRTASIKPGKPFIFLIYRTDCSYCQAETEDILKNMSAFNNQDIYMITGDSDSATKEYAKRFKLERYPNITLARDTADNLLGYFKAPGVPYLAFYDGDKKLKEVVIGKSDISHLKAILND